MRPNDYSDGMKAHVRRSTALPWLTLLLVAVCVTALTFGGEDASGKTLNAITLENAKAGNTGWNVPRAPSPAGDQGSAGAEIEGYASEVSVLPGGHLYLHVSAHRGDRYRVVVYRLGWYHGLGGRRIGCTPSCTKDRAGIPRAIPAPDPRTGEIALRWPTTDAFRLPRAAVSGAYIATLVLTKGANTGKGSYVPFVVRPIGPPRIPTALIQIPVNTWEAYNYWGGVSLYRNLLDPHGHPATVVSFNRPYDANADPWPFAWEYQFIRFIEKHGYSVAYTTDVDTDHDPNALLRYRLVVSLGHDEYWSRRMRDAFVAARDARVNLAFLGADQADWQIRYGANREIIEYRSVQNDPDTDSEAKTIKFRDLQPQPLPNCQLLGVQYQGGIGPNPTAHDYAPNPGALSDSWFAGTNFTASSVLRGLVGYEWDQVIPGCLPNVTVLFHYSGDPPADAVRYTAPSGATVFSSGSLQFTWGLDGWHQDPSLAQAFPPSKPLQIFMLNAMNTLCHGCR